MILIRSSYSVLFVVVLASVAIAQTDSPNERLWCEYAGKEGVGNGKHIVLIAGDDEYRSEEAMPMLGKILAVHHGFKCTVLFPVNEKGMVQPDFQNNIPGLSALRTADLVILGLRFRNLPDDQLSQVDEYLESGRPLIGVRTSTHAFRIKDKHSKYARYSFNHRGGGWDGGFGQRVFGDTWVSHHGSHGKESTRGVVNKQLAKHPVNLGIKDVWGPSDVYEINKLDDSCDVLMFGQILDGMKPESKAVTDDRNSPMMPLAWTKNYQTDSGKTARIFCTTMGAATDFESEGLRRLIVNAAFWALGLEAKIKADFDVSFVDPFNPTNFGFKSFKTGRKPAFYELKNKLSDEK